MGWIISSFSFLQCSHLGNARQFLNPYLCHLPQGLAPPYEKRGSQFIVKVCQQVGKNRQMCNTPLLKRIVTGNNIPHVYPHLIYAYNDVIPTLFQRKNFYNLCVREKMQVILKICTMNLVADTLPFLNYHILVL